MRRTMRAMAFLLAVVVLLPATALAQPMAELTPEDAILYLGWRGAEDMGDDFEGSHLQGVLEETGLVEALRAAGHETEIIPAFSDLAGHAGAVVRHPSGVIEGASDPRADGAALAF